MKEENINTENINEINYIKPKKNIFLIKKGK